MKYIDILVNVIIQQYFASSRCLIILTDELNVFDLHLNLPQLNVKIVNDSLSANIFNYFGCQEIIIKSDNPIRLLQIFEQEIKLHKDRFNFRKYMFIPGEYSAGNITDIFQQTEINFITDIVAIESINVGNSISILNVEVFNIWTHKYRGITSENNEIYVVDKWFSKNRSFLVNNNLFPDKLRNGFGNILKLATFNYEPYVIIDDSINGSRKMFGSELSTVKEFASYHNMTLELVINENDYWGDIWENWTGNGLMGNVVADNADLGVGALYTWGAIYRFLDLSKPTVRTGITCLVPAPKLAAGWLTPLYAYSTNMWLAVIGVFLICVFISFCIQYFYSAISGNTNKNGNCSDALVFKIMILQKALMGIGKVFIQQSLRTTEISTKSTLKYFMGFMFILSLILGSSYSSGLATIMTIPRYENPINTVEDFVKSGLHWGATQDAWITSIVDAEDPKYKKIVSRFVATSEDRLFQLSKSGSFAFSLERLPKENFAIGSYIKEDVIQDFHLMQEDFYWEQCVIMSRKNSVYMPLVDMFVLRVFEAGLISFWQNEAATMYMNPYVQRAVKYYSHHAAERQIVKLKLLHIQGAFGILCLGYVLSFLTFLIEVLISRVNKTSSNYVIPSNAPRGIYRAGAI